MKKKIRIFAFSGALMLGMLMPTTASAYKYYVTLPNGTQVMFHASSKFQALSIFRANFTQGVLTSRPEGGYLDQL